MLYACAIACDFKAFKGKNGGKRLLFERNVEKRCGDTARKEISYEKDK